MMWKVINPLSKNVIRRLKERDRDKREWAQFVKEDKVLKEILVTCDRQIIKFLLSWENIGFYLQMYDLFNSMINFYIL